MKTDFKEKIAKLIERFKKRFDGYVINRFYELNPKPLIIHLYKRIALNELEIATEIIYVKKGKIRYTLLIAKDKNLKTKFYLK